MPEEKRERFVTAWPRSQSRQVDTVARRRPLERQRNRLARQLFGQVVIANRTAVAIVPRPDLRPFFASLGPNGRTDTEPAEVTGSLARLRHDHAWVVVAETPECRSAGGCGARPSGMKTVVIRQ